MMPSRTCFIRAASVANGLAPGKLSGNDARVTRLTPEQFAVVVREVELMIGEGERDEVWRVLKMFADGRFNFRLQDFPPALQGSFDKLGPTREKDYHSLTASLRTLHGDVFDIQGIGNLMFGGKEYEFLKIVSRPSPSPYAVQVPICLVAGVHGDEPDGILAAMEFTRRTYPAFVALLSAVFLGERLTASRVGAIALALAGSGLVAQIHRADLFRVNFRGILFGFLTGLSMAAYSIFGKRALIRYASWTVVLYAFTAGGVFLALMSGSELGRASHYPPSAWASIFALALVPSLGGYALYTLGLQDLPASRASVIATWEVVTAVVLGWLLFGEHLEAIQFVGAALVCLAIGWIQRTEGGPTE